VRLFPMAANFLDECDAFMAFDQLNARSDDDQIRMAITHFVRAGRREWLESVPLFTRWTLAEVLAAADRCV
jgi:hypothetical protein